MNQEKRFVLLRLVVLFLLGAYVSLLHAEETDDFPVAGKVYTINRFGNENAYIYENGNVLVHGPKISTQKQYWQFIPTGTPHRYYVQNVTSKRYMQSTALQENTQIQTGRTPVEYEIVQNKTDNANKGYWYLCSTDQTIDPENDGTKGLNYQDFSGKVVAYHIRWNRGNSYWDIRETNYDYEAPEPVTSTPLAKRLGVYNLPCGVRGTAWLASCKISGEGVENGLNYTAPVQPSDYYHLERRDTGVVILGKTFTVDFTTAGNTDGYALHCYFDWDGDGVFEAREDNFNPTSGTIEVNVPKEAVKHLGRMRVRLTENGLEDAEDDVSGHTYDFRLEVKADIVQGIAETVYEEKKATPISYSLEGKPVSPENYKSVYIREGRKKINPIR